MTRRVAGLVCLVLVAAACGTGQVTETADGAAVRHIEIDARTNRFTGAFLSYFPNAVTVRPGDEVVFHSIYNGEPHTVTMGRLVDQALAGPPENRPKLPTWRLGQSDFLPANIGRPCYLDEGGPPESPEGSCQPVEEVPAFNGRQSYYNSGFLPDDATFRVRLAEDTPSGTYRFSCAFHPEMTGRIEVAEPGAEIPTQGEVDAAANDMLTEFVDQTLPIHSQTYEPFEDARAGELPWPAAASFETFDGRVKVLEFVPFTLKAKVDERVSWTLLGAHTISFDAPENAKPPAIQILTTGETELKAEAINENRSPDPPRGAPKEPVVIEGGAYDDGFQSSGMLFSPKRGLITYAMTFTEPGSYRYECLLHPGMTGLIIVSV